MTTSEAADALDALQCVKDAIATPDRFREWLTANAENVVGSPRKSYRCPIRQFLLHECAITDVSSASINLEYGPSVETPAWAVSFIARVDRLQSDDQVTGTRALDILDHPENNPVADSYLKSASFRMDHPELVPEGWWSAWAI